ncbi:MAG: RluA family pseudouridine synthase [Pseudomonadota bacterium]
MKKTQKSWVVSDMEDGERVDIFLAKKLGIARKQVKKLIDDGLVMVGRKNVWLAKWKLVEGDRVSLSGGPDLSGFRVRVLYEDRDIIAVEKPAGMLSVPKEGSSKPHMLGLVKEYLRRKYSTTPDSFISALHRLDAETSGVILFSLSSAGKGLSSAFKDHRIERYYEAFVDGHPPKDEGVIELSIAKGDHSHGRKVVIDSGGDVAKTRYRVVERYKKASLLSIQVFTGRTHQIRVHLAHIGCPIMGDKIYGMAAGFPRLTLHSARIRFKHPVGGAMVDIKSPLPKDLVQLRDRLL